MTSELPITERNGMFSFMLRSCTTAILAHVLDPSIPYVWIRGHAPKPNLEWWKTQTCLTESGALHDVEVRSMNFDLQFETARFLKLLPEFNGHGMELCQMSRRVPDTLTLDGMPYDAAWRIIVQNGLHLRFDLPHAVENACLASPCREVLEKILQRPEVREVAYGGELLPE